MNIVSPKNFVVCLGTIAVVIFFATSAMAAQVRLDGYYDTREQENITLTVAQNLKRDFGVWGFVDFWTNRANSATKTDDEADFTSFYGEANLNYQVNQSLKLILEINDGSGSDAVLRPGIKLWQKVGTGKICLKVLPYRIDLIDQNPAPDPSGQVSLIWRFDGLSQKIFFEGFCDFNWYWTPQTFHPVVSEPQFGVNLTSNTSVLLEYRYANTNSLTNVADQGWGIGMEYRF
jgi:hypothetical protein